MLNKKVKTIIILLIIVLLILVIIIQLQTNEKEIYLVDKVEVGDFVYYDAGSWTNEELQTISKTGIKINISEELPTQTSEFIVVENRNETSAIYNQNEEIKSGWRVFRKTGSGKTGTVTLIHASHSETYFHGTNILEDEDVLKNRDMSMYVNKYALSARLLSTEDVTSWYNENVGNEFELPKYDLEKYTREDFTNEKTDLLYYPLENINDDIVANGLYYWIADFCTDSYLFYMDPEENRIGTDGFYPFGLRTLIELKPGLNTENEKENDGWIIK